MTHVLYKTKEEIEDWLNQYEIKNHELIEDKEYGFVVNVNGHVLLHNKNIKEIKVKFNIVHGDFYCYNNQLESLYGSPEVVKKNFNCSKNQLKSLYGCPKEIEENFICSENKLTSLKYIGKINILFCQNNKLKSLKYLNQKSLKFLFISNNRITSFKYFPNIITDRLDCLSNPIKNLYYFPSHIENLMINFLNIPDNLIGNTKFLDFYNYHIYQKKQIDNMKLKNILDNFIEPVSSKNETNKNKI